jgi:hypothetical protein
MKPKLNIKHQPLQYQTSQKSTLLERRVSGELITINMEN